MADIKEFTKHEGQFLKAEDVKENTVAKISGVAKVQHNEKYNTDRLHIPVEIEGNSYTFDCSKTNARTAAEVLGPETENWVNAELVLETYKTKTSDGKMVDAINVAKVSV